MQERLELRRHVEIARFLPQHEVRREGGARGHVTSEAGIIVRVQSEPTDRHHRGQYDRQRREDSPDATRVEVREAETTAVDRREDDARNQVAGNDEEYIDADETAGKAGQFEVEKNYGGHSYGAQTINVWTIVGFQDVPQPCNGHHQRASDESISTGRRPSFPIAPVIRTFVFSHKRHFVEIWGYPHNLFRDRAVTT